MTYDIMTYDVMTYEVMTYDIMTYDVMTYDVITFISCNAVQSNSTGLANWNRSKQQQNGPQLNSKLADATYEWEQNVSVYTNATIL